MVHSQIPQRNCPSCHHFYPQLWHPHSDQYHTSNHCYIWHPTTNAFLPVVMIPVYMKNPAPFSFSFLFYRKMCNCVVPLLFHLTCTPSKSDTCFTNLLTTNCLPQTWHSKVQFSHQFPCCVSHSKSAHSSLRPCVTYRNMLSLMLKCCLSSILEDTHCQLSATAY